MFDRTYKSLNSQISPDNALIENTIEMVQRSSKQEKRMARPICRRPLAIAAMLALCIVLATPVLASNVPAIYNLMYLVSPEVAQLFVPVQESCEDNGIRMEVVSTNIHDNTAEIYVAMQDLTGDRVDETTDLFDSYSIHRNFDSSATCQFVGYDAETKTATFMILIEEMGGQDIQGSKLTFTVREFLSQKSSLEDVPVDINLSKTGGASDTQKVNATGLSGINISESADDSYDVLVPGEAVYTPVEGLALTAIGYVDGKLHIQLATSEKLTLDTHGFFYLVDKNGNQVQSGLSVCFAEGIGSSDREDYQEFIFDIPQKEIGNYKLYGTFYKSGLLTKGNWRVTFPLVVR